MDTAATLTYLLGLNPPLIKLNDDATTRLPDILNEALTVRTSPELCRLIVLPKRFEDQFAGPRSSPAALPQQFDAAGYEQAR